MWVEGRLMPLLVLINVSQTQDIDLGDDVPVKIKQRPHAFLWTGSISPS